MSFSVEGGNIFAIENDRIALTTEAPMLNLIPDSAINIESQDIEFPNLWYGLGYLQDSQTSGISEVEGCTTFSAFVEQEWGPNGPYVLDPIILGTVPAGTDYLDVRINMSRIVIPTGTVGLPWYEEIPVNTWVKLEGGSCIPEKQGGIVRLFEIVLDGTNVVLNRYQSVRAGGGFTRQNPGSGGPGLRTYFYAGTNAPNAFPQTSLIGTIIDNKASTTQSHRPPGKQSGLPNNNPCNMSLAGVNYRSVWRGQIRITPGRISG